MAQKEQDNTRHLIWGDLNLDLDNWRDDLLAENPDMTENEMYERMTEINNDYLDDERVNLDIQYNQPIIVIGDIGRWDGRRVGYKMVESGNIKDCLYSDTDFTEWYVDGEGDMRCDAVHHDGTNHYLYRVFKDGVSESQISNFQDKIYFGKLTAEDIAKYTHRLGDEIAKVYGFDIPKEEESPPPEDEDDLEDEDNYEFEM